VGFSGFLCNPLICFAKRVVSSTKKDPATPAPTDAQVFAELLEDYYQTALSPTAQVLVVKDPTFQKNYAVFKVTDGGGLVQTIAIDLTYYNQGMDIAAIMNLESSGLLDNETVTEYLDSEGNGTNNFLGSSSGNLYEATAASTKDLEKLSGLVEKMEIDTAASALVRQYGLSAERGQELAMLYHNFSKAKSSREITNSDVQAMTQEVLGVSLNEAKRAYSDLLKGEEQGMNHLIEQASEVNGVTHEQMKDIVFVLLK